MLLAQLETFLEVARSGSVSRAAETLFLTQPALTGRIKALERELGAPLFLRARRGVELTEAGRAFLPYARRVLEAAAEGSRAVADLSAGGGALTLAVAAVVTFTVLPQVLNRFRQHHPKVLVNVRTANQDEVVDMVLHDQAALGITRDVRHPDLERIVLYEDELVVVVDPAHRLASARTVRVDDLADEHFVLFDRSSSYAELTSAFFHGTRVVPKSVLKMNNVAGVAKLVEDGQGIAILPRSGIGNELRSGRLRALRVNGAATVNHSMVAIRRRSAGPQSEHVKELIAALRAEGGRAGQEAKPARKAGAAPARSRAARRA